MDMLHVFMSMLFILIQIKFDIDINKDELLETIREHEKRFFKKNCHLWCETMQSPYFV